MRLSLLFFCAGGVGALSTSSISKGKNTITSALPSNLRYQPDALNSDEDRVDILNDMYDAPTTEPYLCVSSKLLLIKDLSVELFVRMMKASHSFSVHFSMPIVLPKDIPVRPAPNDDAWILCMLSSKIQDHGENSMESLLVDMPLSTFPCVEVACLDGWIPLDLYQETTMDAMSHICLTQYSLALKMLMSSEHLKVKAGKATPEAKHGKKIFKPNDSQLRPCHEIVILEDLTKLNRPLDHSQYGVLIHYSVCGVVENSRTNLALQDAGGDGVLLHYSGMVHSGTVLWFKADTGEGRITHDNSDGESESFPFHCHSQHDLLSSVNPKIAFRILWKINRSSGEMERWAELLRQ